MYKIGDYVVHESSSVCQIDDIVDMELAGKGSMRTYYTMTPVFKSGAQVFTPVEGSKLKLREVTPAEQFAKIMDEIGELDIIDEENDRLRAEKFKNRMSEFTPEAIASVVKTVLVRKWARIASGKKVMASDEKVLAIAGKKLYEEMSFTMDKTISEVQNMFEDRVRATSDDMIAKVL